MFYWMIWYFVGLVQKVCSPSSIVNITDVPVSLHRRLTAVIIVDWTEQKALLLRVV